MVTVEGNAPTSTVLCGMPETKGMNGYECHTTNVYPLGYMGPPHPPVEAPVDAGLERLISRSPSGCLLFTPGGPINGVACSDSDTCP